MLFFVLACWFCPRFCPYYLLIPCSLLGFVRFKLLVSISFRNALQTGMWGGVCCFNLCSRQAATSAKLQQVFGSVSFCILLRTVTDVSQGKQAGGYEYAARCCHLQPSATVCSHLRRSVTILPRWSITLCAYSTFSGLATAFAPSLAGRFGGFACLEEWLQTCVLQTHVPGVHHFYLGDSSASTACMCTHACL